jgi:hypothetical protein
MKSFLALAAIIATAPVVSPPVARPILVAAVPLAGAPDGAHAYRVVYHSSDGGGKAVDVTGVVMVPAARAPAGGRDIVAWAHGTSGVADACAPSTNSCSSEASPDWVTCSSVAISSPRPTIRVLGDPDHIRILSARARLTQCSTRSARRAPYRTRRRQAVSPFGASPRGDTPRCGQRSSLLDTRLSFGWWAPPQTRHRSILQKT